MGGDKEKAMKNKRNGASPAVNSIDEEACRRLMISLYGSEVEATAVAEALQRYATLQEEEVIERRYNAADEMARQIARELNAPGAPAPAPEGQRPKTAKTPL